VRLERQHWPRLIAEFLVIFLSVILALLADDFRDYRADREAERTNLELILSDLRADGENLRDYAEVLERADRDALRFLELLEQPDVSRDTLWTLAMGLTRHFNHRPRTTAFDGLRDAGRLGLIQDPEVRSGILGYHNFGVRYRMDLKARVVSETVRIDELARRHFTERPGPDGGWVPHVSSTLSEIRADEELKAAISAASRDRRWLITRIETIFLPLNEDVVGRVEAWLER